MPLQKPPPQALPAVDHQASKRRQLQERRRTLQTISELSVADTAPLKLRVTFGPGQMVPVGLPEARSAGTKTASASKRRSLPQYCMRPNCIDARSAPPVPALQAKNLQHMISGKAGDIQIQDRYEAGWNARRDRARVQTEQALAGASLRGVTPGYTYQEGSHSGPFTKSPLAHTSPDYPSLKSRSSQQQFLQSSRSVTESNLRSDRRSSLGSSTKYAYMENDSPSSGHTSTDSSSRHSSRDMEVRRSKSGSSGGSPPSLRHPLIPATMIPGTSYVYASPQYNPGYKLSPPMCMNAPYMPSDRAWSLPVMNLNYAVACYSETPQQHHSQHAQGKSRNGHMRSRHQHLGEKRVATLPNMTNTSQHHTQPSRPSSDRRRSRSRSQSSLKSLAPIQSPPPAYTASATPNTLYDQIPDKSNTATSLLSAHEKRSIPNRENLTKWKTEREEARAEFDGIHRAKMKERVRRANELELEKERELRALGKGMANEKAFRVLGKDIDEEMGMGMGMGMEMKGDAKSMTKMKSKKKGEERGCFGGLFGGVFGK